jgi:hypothetical protein
MAAKGEAPVIISSGAYAATVTIAASSTKPLDRLSMGAEGDRPPVEGEADSLPVVDAAEAPLECACRRSCGERPPEELGPEELEVCVYLLSRDLIPLPSHPMDGRMPQSENLSKT